MYNSSTYTKDDYAKDTLQDVIETLEGKVIEHQDKEMKDIVEKLYWLEKHYIMRQRGLNSVGF